MLDAFGSIEENLCNDKDESKIHFISEVPSKAVSDEQNKGNTLYSLEIRVVNEKTFLENLKRNSTIGNHCGMDSLREFFGNF